MQKKKIILLIALIIIIIAIIALILNTKKQIPQTIIEQAKATYTTEIGDQTFDITNAVLDANDITLSISAGMIPIKWNGKNFEITTFEDTTWYNYSNGQPAYIMLNDGYYKSELAQGITNDQLMENVVGNDALVVPNVPNNNPTIYTYIPRFAYNNQGEILYIKQGCSVAGTYTIPEIFTYKTETRDLSLAGIWVEYTPLANASAVNTKINNMQGENNQYGFIANTIGVNASNEISYKTMIETFVAHIQNPQSANADSSLKQGSQDGDGLPPLLKGGGTIVPDGSILTNSNRTILKIVNSNQIEPIKGNAYYDETEEKIKIEVTYRTNAITKILNLKGNILSENSLTADSGEEIIGNKTYKFIIIDNLGNQKQIQTSVTGLDIYIIENEDDLKLFRDAVNSGKTKSTTRAYQIADVKMNEGKYTIDEESGDIIFASSAEQWVPIGKNSSYFSGTYDGQDNNISGIFIETNENNQGLFGQTKNCTIKNLNVINSKIETSGNVGGIVGYESGTINISNCDSKTQISHKGESSTYIGGIVGCSYQNAYINDCNNNGKITSLSSATIGGIIGGINKGGCNIINCANNATINSISNVAGILGNIGGSAVSGNVVNIENCKNNGDIKGSSAAGIMYNCYYISNGRITIKKSYNTGRIDARK